MVRQVAPEHCPKYLPVCESLHYRKTGGYCCMGFTFTLVCSCERVGTSTCQAILYLVFFLFCSKKAGDMEVNHAVIKSMISPSITKKQNRSMSQSYIGQLLLKPGNKPLKIHRLVVRFNLVS